MIPAFPDAGASGRVRIRNPHASSTIFCAKRRRGRQIAEPASKSSRRKGFMCPIENRPFDSIEFGDEERLVHTLTPEDFSLLAAQAAALGAGIVDPAVGASRAFDVDSAQMGWASALMSALIAGRLPGAGSKLIRQTVETAALATPGDVLSIVARVVAKTPHAGCVTIKVRATNQRGELAMAASADIVAPKAAIAVQPRAEYAEQMREKGRRYKLLIDGTRNLKPLRTAVVHPVDEASLVGALEAARDELIDPVLVGPEAKIRRAAEAASLDLNGYPIVPTEHSHAAAARAVAMARRGEVEALMKGALHTDELMHEVVAADTGLRTARRISHVFAIDAPAYPRPLFMADAAVNIYPTLLDKRDIVQNAIDLVVALGIVTPRVAILSAVETVSPDIRSTRRPCARWRTVARSPAASSMGRSASTTPVHSRRRAPRASSRRSSVRRTSLSFPTSRPETCSPSNSSILRMRKWRASCSARAPQLSSRAGPTTPSPATGKQTGSMLTLCRRRGSRPLRSAPPPASSAEQASRQEIGRRTPRPAPR